MHNGVGLFISLLQPCAVDSSDQRKKLAVGVEFFVDLYELSLLLFVSYCLLLYMCTQYGSQYPDTER